MQSQDSKVNKKSQIKVKKYHDLLNKKSIPELQSEFENIIGTKPKILKPLLIKSLMYEYQCKIYNNYLSKNDVKIINELVKNSNINNDYNLKKFKLKSGFEIIKEYKNIKHYIQVVDYNNFKYNDNFYKSLTAIAMKIAGYKVSGIRFFNLDK